MAAVARERIADEGWINVTVVESPLEDEGSRWPRMRLIFCAVHDILQSTDALRNVTT